MKANSEGFGGPLDPFQYIGRVHRDEKGKVKTMEVFRDEDQIDLEDGDEFVTFVTVVPLEPLP